MIKRIDHVSLAVRDYDKAHAFFTQVIGAVAGSGSDDYHMNYYWQMYSLGDLSRLEIITPNAANSFLDGFLAKKEGGVHHITLHTANIKQAAEKLKQGNVPYFGYSDYGAYWKELYIHPKDAFGVLIQIAEFPPDSFIPLEKKARKKIMVRKTSDGCSLTVAHPGGGTIDVALSKEEVEKLIADLC